MADFPTKDDLLPVVASLVADEWASVRDLDSAAVDPFVWDGATAIGGEALPADSLARIRLATRVGRTFHLEEAGAGDSLLRYHTLGDWAEVAAEAVPEVGKVTFLTSGTTGPPKERMQRLTWLHQEAEFLADYFRGQAPGRRRIHTLAPPHHIYGFLFGVLLPHTLAAPVHHAGNPAHWQAGAVTEGDLLVAFPLAWQYLADNRASFPADVHGVTSTAPCPPELFHRLQAQGLAGLTEIFGSSEAAGVGLRADPGQPFRLMPHWQPGEAGTLIRITPEGGRAGVPFDTDHIAWQDNGHFYPQGRTDSVVQVGGINVHPPSVAEHLAAHPGVAEAEVALPADSDRLAAWITPTAERGRDTDNLRAELEASVRQLQPAERPAAFYFRSAAS